MGSTSQNVLGNEIKTRIDINTTFYIAAASRPALVVNKAKSNDKRLVSSFTIQHEG